MEGTHMEGASCAAECCGVEWIIRQGSLIYLQLFALVQVDIILNGTLIVCGCEY